MDIRIITLEEALPIRHSVLWPDKPLSFCKVDGDETATHYGVYLNNALVTVGSIYIDSRVARLRKFATLENFQGRGIGSQLIIHILSELKKTDIEHFWCDARKTAVSFYSRFGLEIQGDEFIKSDIYYFKMGIAFSRY